MKTALVYFSSMVISALFSVAIHWFILDSNVPSLGASGAIMGLISTAILLSPFRLTFQFIFPIPILFVGWAAVLADITGVLQPTSGNIGHIAHLGGFFSIGLIMFLLETRDKQLLKKGFMYNIVTLIVLVIARTIWETFL